MRTLSHALAIVVCVLSFGSGGVLHGHRVSAAGVHSVSRMPMTKLFVRRPVDSPSVPLAVVTRLNETEIDEEDNDWYQDPLGLLSHPFHPHDLTAGVARLPVACDRLTASAAPTVSVLRC